jgi:c-di-GMP-binding flagellar brake protein YcgR
MESLEQSIPLPELDEDERYEVHSRTEILAILNGILDAGLLVTISFNQGKAFILTSLLHISPISKELVFECGPDEEINRQLLEAQRMTVVTERDHIKIQFRAQAIETTVFEERPAFSIPMPQTVMRLQRRQVFRAGAPASRPIMSKLQIDNAGHFINLGVRVLDISCGGVALGAEGHVPGAEIGKRYEALQIQLPEIGIISSDIEICNMSQFSGTGSKLMTRLGCRFIYLPSAMTSMLQRYVTKLEISRRQRT